MKLFSLGRDLTFYNLLEQQADAAVRAARAFQELTRDYANLDTHIHRIDEIEHEADQLTHKLANQADSTFVTPLDKEDLHALSTVLDDITDAIDDTADMLALYRMPELHPGIATLASMLVQIMEITLETVGRLRDNPGREPMQPLFKRIHELEKVADVEYRTALAELFHSPTRDPFHFVAWKEIYDRLESAVDKCEDVANTVESVVVKYA